MKIANVELTKDRLIIVVSAGAVFIVLGACLIFYAPLIRELRKKHLECKSSESQLLQARNIIESKGQRRKVRVLITEKEVSQAIDELTKHCGLMGVNVISISPKEIREEQGSQFKILPIEMEIKAAEQKFAASIGSLAELEKCLIKVKSFDLVVDAEDKAKLKAKLVLDIHLVNAE